MEPFFVENENRKVAYYIFRTYITKNGVRYYAKDYGKKHLEFQSIAKTVVCFRLSIFQWLKISQKYYKVSYPIQTTRPIGRDGTRTRISLYVIPIVGFEPTSLAFLGHSILPIEIIYWHI